MLHAAFLRSNVAHARINSIDVSAAQARDGVVAVFTADDLGDYWEPGPLLVPPPPIKGITFNQRTQVPLAKDKVRHVGEPLAVVLAESRYLAEDALSRHRASILSRCRPWSIWRKRSPTSRRVHDDVRRQSRRPRAARPGQLRRRARPR